MYTVQKSGNMMTEIQHMLINKIDSKHYDSQETPAILDFERTYTVSQLMVWSMLTLAKYEHKGRATKGQVEADIRKAKTYRDYYEFLKDIITKYPTLGDITAVNAYDILKYKMIY